MKSGDTCPKCANGRLRVRNSYACGDRQMQRLECKDCGHEENGIVPRDNVWQRKSRKIRN